MASAAQAEYTRNIMLTGYWPPTNDMLRQFSTNPEQNPDGWVGQNWEGLGYDIYSYFPEFPDGIGRGVGDFEVDYQDTWEDFWRITEEVKPVAIITFSRAARGKYWEVEYRQRNLEQWEDDYDEPFQPTPAPPDPTVPAGTIRYSSLPMEQIVADVTEADLGFNQVYIDYDSDEFGGAYLSEFMAYLGTWYHDMHASPNDAAWNIAAGHIHVGSDSGRLRSIWGTEVTLRTLTEYLDTQIPEPGSVILLLVGAAALRRPR